MLFRFALGSPAAIAVAAVGGYFALRSVAIDEAKRETLTKVDESGQLVEATLQDGLASGEPESAGVGRRHRRRARSQQLDRAREDLVARRPRHLLRRAAQIGGHYPLDAGQLRLLRDGGAKVEVTDLSRAENSLDRGHGKLIEAYTRIRSPSGDPLLFEIYQRFDSVTARARRLLRALAPPVLGAMFLIVLVQAPLLWSLTHRLQREHDEREALLGNAIAASSRERRRLAAYLHDGPVQDIAGLAFSLAPIADKAEARGDADASVLRTVVDHLRRTCATCARCSSSCTRLTSQPRVSTPRRGSRQPAAGGRRRRLGLDRRHRAPRPREGGARLSRRAGGAAQRDRLRRRERGPRRAHRRRRCCAARCRRRRPRVRARERERRLEEGHIGLSLAEELARQSGGTLEVESTAGTGTRVELEVPAR